MEKVSNKMYKLRIYKKDGPMKGNLSHEELFSSYDQMQMRYRDLFVYNDFSLNPTAWQLVGKEWIPITGI